MDAFAIKVKMPEGKVWLFLAKGASTTRLRIHAVQFERERADAIAADLVESNPGVAAKVVPFWVK